MRWLSVAFGVAALMGCQHEATPPPSLQPASDVAPRPGRQPDAPSPLEPLPALAEPTPSSGTPATSGAPSDLATAVARLHAEVVPAGDYPAWVEPEVRQRWLREWSRLLDEVEAAAVAKSEQPVVLDRQRVMLGEISQCLRTPSYPGTLADLEVVADQAEALRADVVRLMDTADKAKIRALLDRCNTIAGILRARPRSVEMDGLMRDIRTIEGQVRPQMLRQLQE